MNKSVSEQEKLKHIFFVRVSVVITKKKIKYIQHLEK